MRKVSQKDIANSLNISRVTVTRALQGDPEIASATIQKVKARAREMGYIPDFIGRSLSSRRTQTLGLVVPKIAHSFFSNSIEHMYEAARIRGYNLIPTVSFEDSQREEDNVRTLLSMRVDGIILDLAQNSLRNTSYELARRAGSKVIFFDRCPAGFSGSSILADDLEAAYQMSSMLIEKGYREILHLAGPSFLNICKDRLKGYERAMKENQLSPRLLQVDLKRSDGYKALTSLSNTGKLPEAIFTVNDPVAHGVYDAAAELGIRIPDDLAVAGIGDLDASSMLQPPLTSVRAPLEAMAAATVNALIDMIENDADACETQVFASQIIIRGSI